MMDENGNDIRPPDYRTADGRDSKALFVVKSSSPGLNSTILYKISLLTYHAYNNEGCIETDFPDGAICRSMYQNPSGLA
jgi:hypothetical protein